MVNIHIVWNVHKILWVPLIPLFSVAWVEQLCVMALECFFPSHQTRLFFFWRPFICLCPPALNFHFGLPLQWQPVSQGATSDRVCGWIPLHDRRVVGEPAGDRLAAPQWCGAFWCGYRPSQPSVASPRIQRFSPVSWPNLFADLILQRIVRRLRPSEIATRSTESGCTT